MTTLHVKSPNGTEKNIDIDKIFTTDGGTINGDIYLKSALQGKTVGFTLTNNDPSDTEHYRRNLDFGWNFDNRDGAGFYARSASWNGNFGAYARNATNSCVLEGNPEGVLMWDGKRVITNPSPIPHCLSRNVNDSYLQINGGINTSDGATMNLFGIDESRSGEFYLSANNGSSLRRLHGKPDGDLTWDNRHLVTMGVHGTSARGIQTGGINISSVAANSVYDGTVTFPLAFGSVPTVLLSFHGGAKNATLSSFSASVNGFSYRVLNMESTARAFNITWLAIV